MARVAQADMQARKVEVNREKLLRTLVSNLEEHVCEYNEAMAGYKSLLKDKATEAFDKAEITLKEKRERTLARIDDLSEEDIEKQKDYFDIIEPVSVQMRVPKLYEKEYKAAIDMAAWDVNDTMELTHAEFTCFVRDEWDWTSDFFATTSLYK
jgi:hypothetical protein